MKRLICAIYLCSFLITPAALAAPPDSTCLCRCKPQQAFSVIGAVGMSGFTTIPNSCKPPAEKLNLGKMDSRSACEAACNLDANCSSLDICYPSCVTTDDCDKDLACVSGYCGTPAAATVQGQAAAANKEPEFKPIAPALAINIPTLSFSEFAKITREGNFYYIPFISVYLSAIFRLGMGVAAVLAVIMIMVGGFIWIAAAGDAGKIKKAQAMISSAAVGLVLTLCAFVFLQTVNPDLVNLKSLRVPIVEPEIADIAEDQLGDIVDYSQYQSSIAKPLWDAATYVCPPDFGKQPPTGVADPGTLVSLGCPTGVALSSGDSGGGRGTPALRTALCAAGVAADAAGYVLKVTSSYRPFQVQADFWCGKCATNYPVVATRRAYCAVPGFSNHGLGNAVDIQLIDKTTGKGVLKTGGITQCKTDLALIDKAEKIMENVGFVRYDNEIWHFEIGTASMSNRCSPCGLPPKCPKK
jgi:hypothetical protein